VASIQSGQRCSLLLARLEQKRHRRLTRRVYQIFCIKEIIVDYAVVVNYTVHEWSICREVHKMLSNEQLRRAGGWNGSLVEASEILSVPWRRLWNYVSGRPVSIRPWLKTAKLPRGMRARIGKRQYTQTELEKFTLADRLLTAGIPGPVVQRLLDRDIYKAVYGKLDCTVLVVFAAVSDPVVTVFEHGQDWTKDFLRAHANGDIAVVVPFGAMVLELLERTCCFQERREYVKKSAGQQAKEALTAALRERDAAQVRD
jgi:hypothetical protein